MGELFGEHGGVLQGRGGVENLNLHQSSRWAAMLEITGNLRQAGSMQREP